MYNHSTPQLRRHGQFREHFMWTTADGRKIMMPQMTDEHIINCVWYVSQRLDVYPEHIQTTFLNEANYRKLPWTTPSNYEEKRKKIKEIMRVLSEERLEGLSTNELDLFLGEVRNRLK